MKKTIAAIVSLLALVGLVNAETVKVDAGLAEYKPVPGVSGTLNSIGSDTLNNMMTLWAESFKRLYPNVTIQIEGKGSSTAPPALMEGSSQLGPMSREMKSKEVDGFEKKFGYKPTRLGVAIDALAVFVHKDNPIKGMSIKQADAIFSATRRCGGASDIKTWGDIGLSGSWRDRAIQIYGRNSVAGTYGYFKKRALCKGDFKDTVNEQPGSASVVQGVTKSINGIGYSGIGYRTSGVRPIAIAKKGDGFIEPTGGNAINGTYPLSRFLYVYVNKQPNNPLPPLERAFMKMVLSKEGQEVVIKDGYIPVPARITNKYVDGVLAN